MNNHGSILPESDASQAMPSEGELLHTLLNSIPDAIYFKDRQSRFFKANRYWMYKVSVKNERDLKGKTDFDFFTSEHARQAFDDEQEVMRTGRPIVGIEEKETWADKPDSWVSSTKMPLRDSAGNIIGIFGLSRDITEIKKYRDALQQAKDELEDRVKQRTAELSDAKTRLEQHLEQLKYLNVTAYSLAQIVEIASIFDAIGKAFLTRLPAAHVAICQHGTEGFSCVFASGLLDSPEGRAATQSALLPFRQQPFNESRFVASWKTVDHLRDADWPRGLDEAPCWVALPLCSDNALLAVVQLFLPVEECATFEGERTLLSTLAAHAAVCLNNALHYQYLEVKGRLEGELEAARNIQQSLTPQEKPAIPGVSVTGFYQPAYEVGGDYLDYFPCGDGSWAIMVADVCGKGVPAAMLMTVLRSTARVEARTHYSAKSLLSAINGSICFNINERSFITALCLVIAPDGKSMTYARAGQDKLIRLDAQGETVIDSAGIALGLLPDAARFSTLLEEVTIPLVKGETYLAYTDGLSEAVDPAQNIFGLSRILDAVRVYGKGSDEMLMGGILDEVRRFTEGRPARDDLTLFAMKVTG